MWMAYEWGRFMWWLGQGQNAAAVQAITAIVVMVLTVVLIGITWRYARLTRKFTELQLAASFEPNIVLAFTDNIQYEGHGNGGEHESLAGGAAISNQGSEPVKLQYVFITISFEDKQYKTHDQEYQLANPIIYPDKSFQVQYNIEVDKGSTKTRHYRKLIVVCSNLSGISQHILEMVAKGQTRHYLGGRNLLKRIKEIKQIDQV